MARITIEDCLEKIGNRFLMLLTASKRARQLSLGAESPLENIPKKEKPTVTALREIAAGYVPSNIFNKEEN